MYRIGLTGGIATGKSTVARLLKDMGLPVIDLDVISREIMAKGTPGYREILATFGQVILFSNGEIDRKALGRIIFENTDKRKKLEKITHPLILREMEAQIDYLENSGARAVFVEVPLLVEVGMMDQFDQVWLVYVDRELQLKRLKLRDDLQEKEAVLRLNSQMSLEEKRQYADKIILNTGDINQLQKQLDKLWRDLLCAD